MKWLIPHYFLYFNHWWNYETFRHLSGLAPQPSGFWQILFAISHIGSRSGQMWEVARNLQIGSGIHVYKYFKKYLNKGCDLLLSYQIFPLLREIFPNGKAFSGRLRHALVVSPYGPHFEHSSRNAGKMTVTWFYADVSTENATIKEIPKFYLETLTHYGSETAPKAKWSNALQLTARCLSPISMLPVTWGETVVTDY